MTSLTGPARGLESHSNCRDIAALSNRIELRGRILHGRDLVIKIGFAFPDDWQRFSLDA